MALNAPALWHPWVRVERAIRAVLADRLTRGPRRSVDRVLIARVKETPADPTHGRDSTGPGGSLGRRQFLDGVTEVVQVDWFLHEAIEARR